MFTQDIPQRMRRIQRETALQSLYSTVNSVMGESGIEERMEGKSREFKNNVHSLISLVSENTGVRAQELTLLLIPLIYKILSTTNERELHEMKIPMISKGENVMRQTLVNIHKICKDDPYRTLLCKIQAHFCLSCVLNTKEPRYELGKELLWLRQAKLPSDKEIDRKIGKLTDQIKDIDSKVERAERFCEKYRVLY